MSITLPPPIAATTSAPCSRPAATAARARATVGSPATGNTTAGRPSPASRSACRPGLAPVQASTREPQPANSAGSSADRPAPTYPARGGELERFHARRHPGPAPAAQSPLPAGKTAENLVEARGCAIISATVSRQVA